MSKTSMKSLAFHGAGIGLLVIIAAMMLRSALVKEEEPPCSQRYPAPLEFSHKSQSGKLMTPIELEARMGSAASGFLDNAAVVRVEDGPAETALRVRLKNGSGSVHRKGAVPGGISAKWRPASMKQATSACLTYSIWIPEDFDFGFAGSLPGLLAGANFDPAAGKGGEPGFVSQIVWRANGAGEINLLETKADSFGSQAIGQGAFSLPKGRWASFEQEVVLSTPGEADGILRMWIDNALKVEQKKVPLRADDGLRFAGVLMDVSYGSIDTEASAPADTEVRISPIAVRWR